mgnify:CR=1 FL=1
MSSGQDKYLLELHLVLQHRAKLLVHANPISDSGRHCKRKIMHPCYPPALMCTYKTVELHFLIHFHLISKKRANFFILANSLLFATFLFDWQIFFDIFSQMHIFVHCNAFLHYYFFFLQQKTHSLLKQTFRWFLLLCASWYPLIQFFVFCYGLCPIPPSSVSVSPDIYLKSGEASCTQTRPISSSASP